MPSYGEKNWLQLIFPFQVIILYVSPFSLLCSSVVKPSLRNLSSYDNFLYPDTSFLWCFFQPFPICQYLLYGDQGGAWSQIVRVCPWPVFDPEKVAKQVVQTLRIHIAVADLHELVANLVGSLTQPFPSTSECQRVRESLSLAMPRNGSSQHSLQLIRNRCITLVGLYCLARTRLNSEQRNKSNCWEARNKREPTQGWFVWLQAIMNVGRMIYRSVS